MATMNFIKGTFHGRVGQFVGSSWKGKDYLKTFTPPGQPRTQDQVAVRSVFAQLAHVAKSINTRLLKPYTFPRPHGKSEYNLFMHTNQGMFADKVWNPAKLKLFDGPLLLNPIDVTGRSGHHALIDWLYDMEFDQGEGKDIAVGMLYDAEKDEVIGHAVGTRELNYLDFILPDPLPAAGTVHGYLAFCRPPSPGESGMVSKTSHAVLDITREIKAREKQRIEK